MRLVSRERDKGFEPSTSTLARVEPLRWGASLPEIPASIFAFEWLTLDTAGHIWTSRRGSSRGSAQRRIAPSPAGVAVFVGRGEEVSTR